MTLNYCKYLNMVDLRGTQITAVTFNTKGGSLREIYFPTTIQSINLINQALLTDMILPYGEDGSSAPVDLATINIENCPNIQKMIDLISDPTSLAGMKYCRNMTLNNSIKLSKINFNGFTRLANVNLQNMETLEEVDFLNLTEKGTASSLRYIGVSACPKLLKVSLNCDSSDYEIAWSTGSILDLQTSGAVKEVESNCIIKGLETIILPATIEGLYFTDEYGSGYSDVKNIWSAESCTVTKTGVYPIAYHLNSEDVIDEYIGIDFRGLHLLNIDLGALVNIPEAINFTLYPTHINPNFNLHRDGTNLPYLQPEGVLDLTNYTGSLAKFFNGVDFDKLTLACSKTLEQTDYSYCFYNSAFSSTDQLMPLISQIGNAQNLSYMFYKTTIDTIAVLDSIALANNNIIYDYCFGECQNITNTDDLVLSAKVISAIGMFYKCPNLISAAYAQIKVNGSISKIFSDCKKLSNIDGMTIENVKDTSYMFNNDARISKMLEKIPSSCNNANYMYANTNISACDFRDKEFGSSICTYEGFISGASSMTIYLKFTTGNPSKIGGILTDTNNMIVDITGLNMSSFNDLSNWFKDKTALKKIIVDDVIWGTRTLNLSNAFNGCSNLTHDIAFPLNTVNVTNCYLNCTNLVDIHSNWTQEYTSEITPYYCYLGCNNTQTLDGVLVRNSFTTPLDECPVLWGGYGFTNLWTGIYEIKIPSDNYTIKITNTMDDGAINWGDGTVEKFGIVDYDVTQTANNDKWITHTYTTAGTYTIKGKTILSCRKWWGGGFKINDTLIECLVKILQVPYYNASGQGISKDGFMGSAFAGCTNLVYADMTNMNPWNASLQFLFNGCTSLETLLFNVTMLSSNISMTQTFRDCILLKYDETVFPTFPNANQIDIGGCFLNMGKNLVLENDEEVIMDLRVMFPYNDGFKANGGLASSFNGTHFTEIILPNKYKTNNGMADGRSSFTNNKYLKHINLNGATMNHQDFRNFFSNNPLLESIDFTGVSMIFGNYINGMFANNPKLSQLIVGEGEYIDFTNTATDGGYIDQDSTFQNCAFEDLSVVKMWGKNGKWNNTFSGCSKLKKLPTLIDKDTGLETKALQADALGFQNTFQNSGVEDLSEYTFEMLIPYNNGMSGLFSGCTNLVHIGKIITKGSIQYLVQNCTSLTTIDELQLYRPTETVNGDGSISQNLIVYSALMFQNATKLTNVNFTGESQCGYMQNTMWQHAPLSRESLISLFNVLSPARVISGMINSITVNRNSYKLLTDSDIAIATDKGWTIFQATS